MSYELNYYMKMQFAKIIVLACEVIKLNSEYIIEKYHKIITTMNYLVTGFLLNNHGSAC
jgi:hypothetical protein